MWLSHATPGMQMNEIIIVLVLIGDAYVNISRLSYVDKDNKKSYIMKTLKQFLDNMYRDVNN